MTQNRTLSLILPAFGAAIIAALAQIIIPIGAVPITLQTFAVGLVAAILKPREATLAATLYLILGAIGLPVFAGGGGGLQSFFGPSAGYLLAYPFFAFITSKLTHAETPIWKIFVAFVCTCLYRWYPQPALSRKDGMVCSCSCWLDTLYYS